MLLIAKLAASCLFGATLAWATNECEGKQACIALYGTTAPSSEVVWSSQFSRSGVCGCNEIGENCIEDTSCRAWASASYTPGDDPGSISIAGGCQTASPPGVFTINVAANGCGGDNYSVQVQKCSNFDCTGCYSDVVSFWSACSSNACGNYSCP